MKVEGLKKKPKKEKKKKNAKALRETKISEVEPAVESYVAGEVSDSLFPKKSNAGTTALSSLFDTKTSSAQPLYVPVVITKTKRKFPEPDDAKKSKQSLTVLQEVEPKSKVAKKETTLSEKRVEDREQALTNADEAEKKKVTKLKNLKSNKLSEDEDITKQEKKKMIMAEERVKNKRTVFVGNLPSSCTKQMLKSCFKEFGTIETMRFRSVARADPTESRKVAAIKRNLHPKRKSINAYVVFKEEASATKAIVRNGFEMGSGFHIRVDLASRSPAHDNKKTVFVGNLPYDIEDEALRQHFSDCGTIEGVRIIRDKSTGIGKGFGYVLFQGTDAVLLALKLGNSELMGRKLRIKRCVANDAKGPDKNSGFRPKFQPLNKGHVKKHSFVGERADSTKSKNKRPNNKINQMATKPNKKPFNKPRENQTNKKPFNKPRDNQTNKKPFNKPRDNQTNKKPFNKPRDKQTNKNPYKKPRYKRPNKQQAKKK
ncbi:RNA-binding protein 34 [Anomaloglossus baeobatrachus]|uniref:RNA-binding protein 34 n=1 Tax=Anomaloglossus baeobatrachus TaxID=238106 RepID=UPI003F4FCB7F